jgi:nitrate reductase molybdenum cofactor assembly chaperone NarJ/NarW
MSANAWQCQSLLIGYPDEQLYERLDLISEAARAMPGQVGEPLLRMVGHLRSRPPGEAAVEYVATFDHRKRCCLFLTYYAHGDTRNRGMALLELKQTYAAAGWLLSDEELSDHLSVVLEFAAATGDRGPLVQHRSGLELLRLALHDAGSPWAAVVDSVAATLPPLAGHQRAAVEKLVAGGPPVEKVGLEPYGAKR